MEMPEGIAAGVAVETHDEFVIRASRVFPLDRTQTWSRLERAVFNSLMAKLMFQRGYAAISDDMLLDLRQRMEKLVRQYQLAAERSAPPSSPFPKRKETRHDCSCTI